MSACIDEEAAREGISGIDKYQIATPSLKGVDELEEIDSLRTKVSRVDIVAPRAGDLITEITAHITQGQNYMIFRSEYWLEDDLAPVTREASQLLFEIDPGAGRYAKISMMTKVATRLDKTQFCNPWVTNLTVELQVAEVPLVGREIVTNHSETVEETTCSTLFPLPFSGHIEDPLEKAFRRVVIKAIRERASGTAPSVSAGLSR